jgi:predicted DCC family thiol-disulfide oxidoreductase YuxK
LAETNRCRCDEHGGHSTTSCSSGDCCVTGFWRIGEHFGMTAKLTVWYNTKCPVCNAGINWQQNRLVRAAQAGAIEFRDINLEPAALARFGAGVNDVRRRLHGVDAEGRFFVGMDCAIEIWRRTPGDDRLARIIGLPVVRQLAGFGYDRFADVLYLWNRLMGHW